MEFGALVPSRPWLKSGSSPNGLFAEPALPALPASAAPAYQDISGCRVFAPGVYTTAPNFASYNYFKSGNYVFNVGGSGKVEVKNAVVTAGREGTDNDAQQIPNAPCDDVRDAETEFRRHLLPERVDLLRRGGERIPGDHAARGGGRQSSEHPNAFDACHHISRRRIVIEEREQQADGHPRPDLGPDALVELGNVTNSTVAQINGSGVGGRST